MKHVSKMKLIDEDVLSSLQTKSRAVTGEEGVEKKLSLILNNQMLGDDEKMKLYQQALGRLIADNKIEKLTSVKSEVYDKPIHPPAGGGLTSQMIIESLPERQKKKAGEMIRRIVDREMGSRVWNERGELLDENGLAVVGSSITDLIKTSRSSGKTDKNPHGWREFVRRLHSVGIKPAEILNKNFQEEYKSLSQKPVRRTLAVRRGRRAKKK